MTDKINKTNKCECGNTKKPWFPKCYDCIQKENQKPKCDICNIEVPKGHNLCKEHWKEQQEDKKKIRQVKFVAKKKIENFDEKYPGKYKSPYGKVKSKSELLLTYFFYTNNLKVIYENTFFIKEKEYKPDFTIQDENGNTIIFEHFGMDTSEYIKKREKKIKMFKEYCKDKPKMFFTFSTEEDFKDLKLNISRKFEELGINKGIWE